MYDWEKQQAENNRNREIDERAKRDREAGRYAQSGFHPTSTDHRRYTDSYNK